MKRLLLPLLFIFSCGPKDTGSVDTGTPGAVQDADGDGYPASEDCDDTDPYVHPGQPEACNGLDDDCDGEVDEGVTLTFYVDADGDGYGDPDSPVQACEPSSGLVSDSTDCDDTDPEVNVGASERCNGQDDNCNGLVDEGLSTGPWYADADGDGYGDPTTSVETCDPPSGYVLDDTDCDDADPAVNPGQPESCNGVDDDCDGFVDEYDAVDASTWYRDADGDGYGNPSVVSYGCSQPSGYVADGTDCDDGDAGVHPGATEVCDPGHVDEDCDGLADDADPDVDPASFSPWYADADGDGYGDPDAELGACSQPSGYVADDTDCDDGDAGVYPGADELCDGVDQDCDGSVDEDALDAPTWYLDADGDGYGTEDDTVVSCTAPSGYVADGTDCDDGDASVYPGQGCAVSYDGTYTGEGEVQVEIPDLGYRDSCTYTDLEIEVEEGGASDLQGSFTCTLSGSPVTGSFLGTFDSEDEVSGLLRLRSFTTYSVNWSGTFTDSSTLEGSYSDSLISGGVRVFISGSFTATR